MPHGMSLSVPGGVRCRLCPPFYLFLERQKDPTSSQRRQRGPACTAAVPKQCRAKTVSSGAPFHASSAGELIYVAV
jgi:hypothetical protein